MIILVTGSRDWRAKALVAKALSAAVGQRFGHGAFDWSQVTVRHGDCPTGADKHADEIARSWGMKVDARAADWDRFGKAAGPIRNTELVEALPKPDLCITFGLPSSKGTFDCASKARAAGIPTVDYGEPTAPEVTQLELFN